MAGPFEKLIFCGIRPPLLGKSRRCENQSKRYHQAPVTHPELPFTLYRCGSKSPLASKKEAAPRGTQVEPALRVIATRWNCRNVEQSVSPLANEFCAVPFQECLQWPADLGGLGERSEAYRTALPLS